MFTAQTWARLCKNIVFNEKTYTKKIIANKKKRVNKIVYSKALHISCSFHRIYNYRIYYMGCDNVPYYQFSGHKSDKTINQKFCSIIPMYCHPLYLCLLSCRIQGLCR